MEEVDLSKLPPNERERYDNMTEVYSIIATLDWLEKLNIKRGGSLGQDYTDNCYKLLMQYRAAFKLIEKEFHTPSNFLEQWGFECPMALDRIREGRPMTVRDDMDICAKTSAVTEIFITFSDRLRLGMRSMSELEPDLKALKEALGEVSGILPANYEGVRKVSNWLERMRSMSAGDQLDSSEIQQLSYDIESSYSDYQKILRKEFK